MTTWWKIRIRYHMPRRCRENWMLRVKMRSKRGRNCKRKWTSWNLAQSQKNTKSSPTRGRSHTHPNKPSSKTSSWNKSIRTGVMRHWIARLNQATSTSLRVDRERDRRILSIRSVIRQLWKDHNLESADIHLARFRSRRHGRQREGLLIIKMLPSRSIWMQQVLNRSAIRVRRMLISLHFQPRRNLKFPTMSPLADKITIIREGTIRSGSNNKTQNEKKWMILLVCLMKRGCLISKRILNLRHNHQWIWDQLWISKISNLNSSNFNPNSCANWCRMIKALRISHKRLWKAWTTTSSLLKKKNMTTWTSKKMRLSWRS